MAPTLPPIVTALVGGGIRRGCTEDKRTVSHDTTQLPISADRGPPQTSAGGLKAFDSCPLANEHKEEDSN